LRTETASIHAIELPSPSPGSHQYSHIAFLHFPTPWHHSAASTEGPLALKSVMNLTTRVTSICFHSSGTQCKLRHISALSTQLKSTECVPFTFEYRRVGGDGVLSEEKSTEARPPPVLYRFRELAHREDSPQQSDLYGLLSRRGVSGVRRE
jgi:hypothetical protein